VKIFITGAAGFLGSHLAEHFIKEGHTVVGCDNLIGGDIENVSIVKDIDKDNKYTFHIADCCDNTRMSEIISDMGGCDVLYHCAATAHEGLSVFSPSFITKNIFEASVSVFSAAIANNVKRIVFTSSMARYGIGEFLPPFREIYTPLPEDPYGIAKVAAEQVLKVLCEVNNVEYVIAVPHNIIGPRQCANDPYRNVASIMVNRMKQGLPPIVYGDGKQTRCFSYVGDVISCLAKMIDESSVVGEVINVGPDEEENTVNINDLAAILNQILGTDFEPIHMGDRPQEVKHATCSSEKARTLLGYRTKTELREGLRLTAESIEPQEFVYDRYPLEIVNDKTPKTWKERLI